MQIETHRQKMIIFTGIIISILLFAIDFMIIVPAMPKILSEIGGLKYINWVFTAFMLTQTITSPIYGKLSDIFSRKKMFLLAIVIFVSSSALAGLSSNIYELVIARGVQGIGGGAIMIMAMSMIGEIFSIKERAKYQGYLSATFGFASVAGPIFGAYITDSFSWRWIFFINLPIGIISFLIIYFYLPKNLHQARDVKVDYIGSLLLSLFLVPMILGFSFISQNNSFDMSSILLFITSAIFFAIFYIWERKITFPIFSHHLFYDRNFMVPASMTFITAIFLFAVTLYTQIFAQKILGLPITEAGMVTTAMVVPMTVVSALIGQFIAKTGRYKIVVNTGAFIIFLSMILFSIFIPLGLGKIGFVAILLFLGLGMGGMMSSFNIIVQIVYGRERMGEVMGALQLARGVGGVFGTALLGVIFGYFVKDIEGDKSHLISALTNIFYLLTIFSLASFVVSLFMNEKRVIHS